ncbi:hypothetical protein LU679_21490 [Pseudomonas putida]|nr:hypothetical protein [Pseudomonas putida]MCE0881711.1 hypothetical protein [Pseudomonas putida]PTC01782.1 hypothetical protein C9975_00095 [Thalassospira xiamenensis]
MQPRSTSIHIQFHGRDFTDFQLKRLIQAKSHGFPAPVTAYLSDVFLASSCAVGVVFDHQDEGPYGRYSDGNYFQTSKLVSLSKEGRFWVATAESGRYVIATFKREMGRASLRSFLTKGV